MFVNKSIAKIYIQFKVQFKVKSDINPQKKIIENRILVCGGSFAFLCVPTKKYKEKF